MSCGCGLKPRHPVDPDNQVRKDDVLPRAALEELKAHMLQEEDEVIPRLPMWAQREILLDHARFWHDLAVGRMPNRFDLLAHAGREDRIYKRFGFAHHDLAPTGEAA